ncbi:hypothetical protein C0Q70_18441, partial [Pomacea canaliculata]
MTDTFLSREPCLLLVVVIVVIVSISSSAAMPAQGPVVFCDWIKSNLNCITARGYEFGSNATDQLTLRIPRLQDNDTGTDDLNCTTAPGYELSSAVTDVVVITTPQASRDQAGSYSCHVIGSEAEGFESCEFIVVTELTDPFNVCTGVKQGCILSPFLFILAMDWIMKTSTDSERRGIRWTTTMTATTTLEDLDFADDIALLSHRYQDMHEKTNAFSETAGNLGLKVSTQKTNSLRVNDRVQDSIKLNREEIEAVDSFSYLGSKMSNTRDAEVEIRARLANASQAFASLRSTWKATNISQKIKLRIFKSTVISNLLDGSESWKMTKSISNRLDVFQNRCLRRILHILWPNTITNEELKPSPSPRRFNEGVGDGLDMCSASRQQTSPQSPCDGLQTAEENEAAHRKLGEE